MTANPNALLTFLEDDTILTFAPALVTFLTNVKAAGADPIKLSTAWIQLQGDVVGAAPGGLAGLEGQLAGLILQKLQALQAAAQASLNPGPAPLQPPA